MWCLPRTSIQCRGQERMQFYLHPYKSSWSVLGQLNLDLVNYRVETWLLVPLICLFLVNFLYILFVYYLTRPVVHTLYPHSPRYSPILLVPTKKQRQCWPHWILHIIIGLMSIPYSSATPLTGDADVMPMWSFSLRIMPRYIRYLGTVCCVSEIGRSPSCRDWVGLIVRLYVVQNSRQ